MRTKAPRAALARGRVEEVAQQAQLVVAADERRLETLRPTLAATLRDDPERSPGPDRRLLPAQQLLARFLVGNRPAGRTLGRLADQHEPAGTV